MLGWRAWEPGTACSRTDATMQQSSNNDTSDNQTSLISNTIRTPRYPSKGNAGQLALRKSSVHSPAAALVHHPRGSSWALYSGEPV